MLIINFNFYNELKQMKFYIKFEQFVRIIKHILHLNNVQSLVIV